MGRFASRFCFREESEGAVLGAGKGVDFAETEGAIPIAKDERVRVINRT